MVILLLCFMTLVSSNISRTPISNIATSPRISSTIFLALTKQCRSGSNVPPRSRRLLVCMSSKYTCWDKSETHRLLAFTPASTMYPRTSMAMRMNGLGVSSICMLLCSFYRCQFLISPPQVLQRSRCDQDGQNCAAINFDRRQKEVRISSSCLEGNR